MGGVTDVVRNLGGTIQANLRVLGTANDPHFSGRVDVAGASFAVASTGARYRNGRAALNLSTERVTVEALHLEDVDGDALTALVVNKLRGVLNICAAKAPEIGRAHV